MVTRRKSHAVRSPSNDAVLTESSLHDKGSTANHTLPPAMFSSSALQSLIYATSNDRYPGAPGTLLHRARLETQRALAASKREAQREAERRDEMKRLGILGVGKKRVNGGTNPSDGRTSRYNTPPNVDRARRSAAQATSLNNANGVGSSSSSSSSSHGATSSRPARSSNGRNNASVNSIDHDSLPVPQNSSSPLLSAAGRVRRPATSSRNASPMPLTGGPNGTVSSRLRSPVVPPLELDDGDEKGTEDSSTPIMASS